MGRLLLDGEHKLERLLFGADNGLDGELHAADHYMVTFARKVRHDVCKSTDLDG